MMIKYLPQDKEVSKRKISVALYVRDLFHYVIKCVLSINVVFYNSTFSFALWSVSSLVTYRNQTIKVWVIGNIENMCKNNNYKVTIQL